MIDKSPSFQSGRLIKASDLSEVVKEVREQEGLSHRELADALRITEPAVHEAEKQSQRARFRLRKRIIERYTGFTLDGPYYRLKRK